MAPRFTAAAITVDDAGRLLSRFSNSTMNWPGNLAAASSSSGSFWSGTAFALVHVFAGMLFGTLQSGTTGTTCEYTQPFSSISGNGNCPCPVPTGMIGRLKVFPGKWVLKEVVTESHADSSFEGR